MKQQTVSKMERVQTAVEWFAFQIMDSWNDIQNGKTSIDKLIEQAKKMEKEQHKHTWLYEGNIDNASYERFERYYQVTFGGQGSPDNPVEYQFCSSTILITDYKNK